MTNNLTTFVEYLQSLAPEGETALLLWQKPRLYDGEIRYHADGAPKAVFPAFLPAAALAKMQPGQAWYGNTGSYLLDRLQTRVSASRANCEYCLVLILDDVGTKSKVPPLEPTWKMETSKGSYQWGYAFGELQPTKSAFAAAIRAIANAGYTDPGAINPVRNFRLPGSVNLKQGRDLFVAQLVEFHPEREFELEQICKALGVEPGAPEGDGIKSIAVEDDGGDDVFAWLGEQGLVLSRPNAEGWAGVVCPQHDLHSDGSPEGRYKPATRSYCCMHGHCVDLNSEAFLTWVADNGGPRQTSGLREELVAAKLTEALSKIAPGPSQFADDAEAASADCRVRQELREAGATAKADWHRRFVYVQSDDSYFDLETRRELTRRAFDSTFRHIRCQSIHATGQNGGRLIQASICFDENRQALGGKSVVGITYAPGRSELVQRNGEAYCNRWRDARPPRVANPIDPQPWLDHLARLFPVESEREHLLNVMAFKLQNPGTKINHGILIGSTVQGNGKDLALLPFLWAVCGEGMSNRGQLDSDTIAQPWGYAFESEILVMNEIRENANAERRGMANRLKPLCAAPPLYLSINRKGLAPYDGINVLLPIAMTNWPDPFSLDSADRRWFCLWVRAPFFPDAERLRLLAWYEAGGYQAVAALLWDRDVSAWDCGMMPPMTDWKRTLIESSLSAGESYLVDLIKSRSGEFSRGAVASPFHALCDRLQGAAPQGAKVYQGALLHALTEAGWLDCGRVMSSDFPSRKQVYCAPDLAHLSKSELRRLVEQPPAAPGLRVAK